MKLKFESNGKLSRKWSKHFLVLSTQIHFLFCQLFLMCIVNSHGLCFRK